MRGIAADDDDDDSDRTTASPLGERKGPLLLPEPHRRQIQFLVTLPAGYTVKALPDSSVKHYGPATVGQHYDLADEGVIVATFSLDTGPGRFTAEQVDELRQAIERLSTDGNSPWEVKIELENKAGAEMAAGHVAEALACARREMANRAGRRRATTIRTGGEVSRYADPDYADQHVWYSRLLLKAGLGEAARAEAQEAVKLEYHGPATTQPDPRAPDPRTESFKPADYGPGAALAYANLARTLACDLLGRQFRPGMDWAGAAAAYQKALELDPSDVATRMDWAVLLEHDEDGLRYAPGARMDDAIEEYRKAQRQLGPRNRMDCAGNQPGHRLALPREVCRAGKAGGAGGQVGGLASAFRGRGRRQAKASTRADRLAADLAPAGDARRRNPRRRGRIPAKGPALSRRRPCSMSRPRRVPTAVASSAPRPRRWRNFAARILTRNWPATRRGGRCNNCSKRGLCGGKAAEKIPSLLDQRRRCRRPSPPRERPCSAPSIRRWRPPARTRFRRCGSPTA